MAKLIIPTRNRPASLGSVLTFVAHYFPGTAIIIADGSAENYRSLNRSAIAAPARSLDIDYRPYDPDLPFFDRILDVLGSLSDDLIVMGADDDYPQLDVLAKAEQVLATKPDHVSAFGAVIHLKLVDANRLTARLDHAHPVSAPTAAQRANAFAEWPFSTTYAVTRREHLIERYRRAKRSFLVGFYDFKTGVHDAMAGKLAVVPGISYLSTHNFTHSYLRAEDGLVFLRHAGEVFGIHEQFSADLIALDGLEQVQATALATRLIKKRISALVDLAPHRRPGFELSRVYQMPSVQKQIADFYAMFSSQSPMRSVLEPRLRYIVDSLQAVAASQDNLGENATYETLDAQADGGMSSAAQLPTPGSVAEDQPRSSAARPAVKSAGIRDAREVAAIPVRLLRRLLRQPAQAEPVPPLHFDVNLATLVKE